MENNNNSYWQKCPICGGSGMGYNFIGSSHCSVCNGHGIIDSLSGAPPQYKKFWTGTTTTPSLPEEGALRVTGYGPTSTTDPGEEYKSSKSGAEIKDIVKITEEGITINGEVTIKAEEILKIFKPKNIL